MEYRFNIKFFNIGSLFLSFILLIYFFAYLPLSTNIFYKSKSKIIIENIDCSETCDNKLEIISSNYKVDKIFSYDLDKYRYEILIKNNFFKTKKLNLLLKSIDDGFIKIILTNVEKNKNGINTQTYVKYNDFIINGKKIIQENAKKKENIKSISNSISDENPFEYTVKVKKNEIISIDLKTRNSFNFNLELDFKLFFVLLMILYIISYKIINLVQKILKDNNTYKLDIIFIFIIFIILFFPVSRLSDSDVSNIENRTLAKYKSFFINENKFFKINKNWTSDFDKFFNDRFRGRDILLKINIEDFIKKFFSSSYTNDGVIYFRNNNWFIGINYLTKITKDDKKSILKNVEDIKKFCSLNNIKLYFFVIPKKEKIYKEILFQLYEDVSEDKEFFNFIRELKTHFKINQFMYPYQEYIDNKKNDYIFPKSTHHLSDYGTYISYKIIMNNIKKDFKDIKIVSLSDYKIMKSNLIREEFDLNWGGGSGFKYLNFNNILENKILDTQYNWYDNIKNPDIFKFQVEKKDKILKKNFPINKNGKYNIFLIGSSNSEQLLLFLPYSAKKTNYIRYYNLNISDEMKQEILNSKTDILIFYMTEDNLSL